MNKTLRQRLFGLLLAAGLTPAGAVELSTDGSGQVLLYPLFLTGSSFQTLFEIRNQSAEGKALRFVVKDPVNGRPTLSLNIYLTAGDSWSGALFTADLQATVDQSTASLAPWNDLSCTFPSRASVPAGGLALSDEFFSEDLSDILAPQSRLALGFVEVYEMGTLSTELAGNCAEIDQRWAQGGIWTTTPGQDLSAPRGGVEGYAIVVNTEQGRAHQYEALALQNFRTEPLHTDPRSSRQPSLMDVFPAESRVVQNLVFGNQIVRSERISTWSDFPVHAVDALLMATEARTDFSVSPDFGGITFAALNFPTRTYHVDRQGYFLPQGQDRVLEPFKASLPLAPGETLADNIIAVSIIDREGRGFELQPFAGRANCDLANGAVSIIFKSNTIGFTEPCAYTRAEFRVPSNASEGEVRYQLSGELVSDEGDVYQGLPVAGFVIQSITNANIELRPGVEGIANYGWARALKLEREVSGPR